MFLLHNEDERESWISAIKKLQPKGNFNDYGVCGCGCVSTVYDDVYFLAVQSVTLSQFELQDLLSRQKVHVSLLIIANNSNNNDTRTSFIKFHVKFSFERRKRKEIAFTKKTIISQYMYYFSVNIFIFITFLNYISVIYLVNT